MKAIVRVGNVLVVAAVLLLGFPGAVADEVIPKVDFSGLSCIGVLKLVTRPTGVPGLIPLPGSGPGDGLGTKLTSSWNHKEVAYFDFQYINSNLNWYLLTGYTEDPQIDCDPFSSLPCDVPYLSKVWDWVGQTEEAVESGNLTAVPPPPEPDPAINCPS